MEYIYAALLVHKLGKEVTEESVRNVVKAAGVDVDDSKLKSLIASLKGVDIDAELANAGSVAMAPASSTSAPAEAKKEEKAPKEEKKPAAAEGLASLFG